VGTAAFRDHHQFTPRDIVRITKAARSAAAAIVLTTEKDAVRLEGQELDDLPIASVPLVIGIEPPDQFREWLLSRLRASASQHPRPYAPTHPQCGTALSI
jgi:tetraacyldisaccharide-1-P 4'-kinase